MSSPDSSLPQLPPDLAPAGETPTAAAKESYVVRLQALLAKKWKARQRGDTTTEVEERAHAADQADPGRAPTNARTSADAAAETALTQAIHDGYVAIARSSLDRAAQRATFITATAGAITTLYIGILALRFGTGEHATPITARALAPAVFLGLSIVLATFFVAFLRHETTKMRLLPTGSRSDIAEMRLRAFLTWTFEGVVARSWSLRMAVVSLGIGVALLPAPLTNLDGTWIVVFTLVGGLVLAAWGCAEWVVAGQASPYAGTGAPIRPTTRGPGEGAEPNADNRATETSSHGSERQRDGS